MLGLNRRDTRFLIIVILLTMLTPFLMQPFPEGSAMAQFNGGYPDLMAKIAIFGIFAMGFNILFGLTGYLSFGHAAFLGVGSYAAVWMFKLLTLNVFPAIILAVLVAGLFSAIIGYISLRRSGIYFSILTLAMAEMSYRLAYSVFTPITNGETGLQVRSTDPRILDGAGAPDYPNLFGLQLSQSWDWAVAGHVFTFNVGYYFSAIIAIVMFYITLRIFRSPFGLILKAIKTNQTRLNYTGINTRPYALSAFIISGMYAGLAGGLLAVMDPLAGAERMQWTASGEVVIMTILGGAGTLLGPVLGAGAIKYLENIFSKINENVLHDWFGFLPDWLSDPVVWILSRFTGDGWSLTLGLMFMAVVIFLPGGLVEGGQKIAARFRRKPPTGDSGGGDPDPAHHPRPAPHVAE